MYARTNFGTDDTSSASSWAANPLTQPNWLVWVEGGDPVGPVSAEQLARGIRAGRVPAHASVQRQGDVFWSDILDEPDVIAALKAI